MKPIVRATVLMLSILAGVRTVGAQTNHWTGTWGTAVVARERDPQDFVRFGRGQAPQGQARQAAPLQGPTQGVPPQARRAGPGGPSGPPGSRGFSEPPLNVNNQTLRQIV